MVSQAEVVPNVELQRVRGEGEGREMSRQSILSMLVAPEPPLQAMRPSVRVQ